MGSISVGREAWHLVGAEGGPVVPPEHQADVPIPRRWRIFGPLRPDTMTVSYVPWASRAEPLVSADVERLTFLPDELPVANEILKGRDVEMDPEKPLDLADLLGGYDGTSGHNAYAMAEMDLDGQTDVVFGAACDYWMQFWIDGQLLLDTLDGGNGRSEIFRTDHCAHRRLAPGKHLLVIRAISGSGSWRIHAGLISSRDETLAMAEHSDRWEFLSDTNEILPPWDPMQPTLAVRTDLCLADETIEFDYQQDYHAGYVGIIFGAQDSDHYYFAYVPRWGQLHRARAFYAAIGKTDGSGYIRNLRMQLMPNVPVILDAWGSIKVQRRGEIIRMWVNGVEGPCVADPTYGPGHAGIAGASRFRIRNLKIDGRRAGAVHWPTEDRRSRPWALPIPPASRGHWHSPGRFLRLSDDEILMTAYIGRTSPQSGLSFRRQLAENTRTCLFLSGDQGRTWTQHGQGRPAGQIPHGLWCLPSPGVIRAASFEAAGDTLPDHDPDDHVKQRFVYRESTDKGLTWSQPVEGELLGNWHDEIFLPRSWNEFFGAATLPDGTLLAVILHGWKDMNEMIPHFDAGCAWGSGFAQPYCTVSKDQGLSWSRPVPMDHAVVRQDDRPKSHCGGFSETAVAQLPSGRIVAIARPFHSPFMWQTHSEDGGATWRMACYAPFSGAGSPQLVATRSGYLAMVARCVGGVGMHVSIDGGLNWDQGTTLDNASYFNGSIIEVEPDVVLVIYPDVPNGPGTHVRAQRIRITPQGPVALDQ